MKQFLLLVGFVVAGIFEPVQAENVCGISTLAFKAGEVLNYQLYYNVGFIWVKAGTCDFAVDRAEWDNKKALKLSIVGRTDPSFDSFFHVRDSFISYVDNETLTPYKSYKYTHEDKWLGTDIFTFRPSNGGWRITTNLKRKGVWKDPVESVTPNCGFDILTSIYRMRSFDEAGLFLKGHAINISVRLDDGEYVIHMTYLGKERIKLHSNGYYTAKAFQLTLVEGKIFKRGDVLKMWISDDGNCIPLMIESPIRVGSVKAIFRTGENTLRPIVRPAAIK